MSEFTGPENIESRNERIVASITGTISEILKEHGFFSVSVTDIDTHTKFIFLEQELPNFLTSESLVKYLTETQEKDKNSSTIVTELRNKILQKISSLFVVNDDFVGRFNEECKNIIEGLIISKP